MSQCNLVELESSAQFIDRFPADFNYLTSFYAELTSRHPDFPIGAYFFKFDPVFDIEAHKTAARFLRICRAKQSVLRNIFFPRVFTHGQILVGDENGQTYDYTIITNPQKSNYKFGGLDANGDPSKELIEIIGAMNPADMHVTLEAIDRMVSAVHAATYVSFQGFVIPPTAFVIGGFTDHTGYAIVPQVGLLDLSGIKSDAGEHFHVYTRNNMNAKIFTEQLQTLAGGH